MDNSCSYKRPKTDDDTESSSSITCRVLQLDEKKCVHCNICSFASPQEVYLSIHINIEESWQARNTNDKEIMHFRYRIKVTPYYCRQNFHQGRQELVTQYLSTEQFSGPHCFRNFQKFVDLQSKSDEVYKKRERNFTR